MNMQPQFEPKTGIKVDLFLGGIFVLAAFGLLGFGFYQSSVEKEIQSLQQDLQEEREYREGMKDGLIYGRDY